MKLTLDRANEILDLLRTNNEKVFCEEFIQSAKIVHISKTLIGQPLVRFQLHTEPWMRNSHDIVHGGCTATMVDYLTTYAAVGDESYWKDAQDISEALSKLISEFGLSRHISVQYQRAIPIDEDIYIDCVIESSTRRFINVSCKIHDGKGRIYATATHDKVKQFTSKI